MGKAHAHLASAEVLIVEDEPLLRKRLAASLQGYGAEVTTADSLEEARNCLESLFFDFALTDVHLPDGLGLDLLRAGDFAPDTAVVIMTAEGGSKLRLKPCVWVRQTISQSLLIQASYL